jgi:F-type H+-transporting ATPase subunit a
MSFYHWIILQTESLGEAADSGAEAVEHGSGSAIPHLQNIVLMIANYFQNFAHNSRVAEFLESWENVIYSWLIMLLIAIFFITIANKLTLQMKRAQSTPDFDKKTPPYTPGRLQNFVEILFGGLETFVVDVLGPKGRTYVPLLGTIFIYVLSMNLAGFIPIVGHSPSSSLNITLSLAVTVFVIVQIHGIRALGILGYLRHFADLPDKPHPAQIILAPLMFFLHLIGELAKPVSLSLRLFGNITGEDVLIAVFVGLAMSKFIPLQFFMYPIALMGSFIQALVFMILSTVYIMLMSPHGEEH